MRQREYGGVPWYLMFTIAASIGSGIGTYKVLHERELRLAEERARAPKPPPPPPPKPIEREPIEAPQPEPTPEPVAETPPTGATGIPSVTIQRALVMGDLDEVGVEIRVAAQREAIEQCYQNVTSQGTIAFSMSVSLAGRVTAVTSVGTPFDRGLSTCVITALKRVRFTAPANGEPAETTIPIEFKRL